MMVAVIFMGLMTAVEHRHETEDEDDERDPTQLAAAPSHVLGIVDGRMAAAQPEQQYSERQPPRPDEGQRDQGCNGAKRDLPVPFAGHHIQDMATIELPYGQQVQTGSRDTHPGRARYRVKINVGRLNPREDQVIEQPLQLRHTKMESLLDPKTGYHFGKCEADAEGRKQENEPRQRTRHPDIKQRPLGIDRGANPDKG